MGIEKHLNELADFAIQIVKESEEITLKYFKKTLKPSFKQNNTPVTTADFACEDYLINRIKEKFPEHGILSEERGKISNHSPYKWIIDPIDGTRNFIRNYSFWGTLLALEYNDEIVLGIISMPSSNDLIWAAKGKGCYKNNKQINVSGIDKFENAYCLYGGLGDILKQHYSESILDLIKKCTYSRGYGDCLGHSLVISGNAEIMIDPFVAPYDIAPVKICIEEAGGKLTDIFGNDTIYAGNALATNGKMHDTALKILNG